ncbi:M28 family metallopeptidase [Nocardioides sp. GXZ039]|uniref:M28 family metallopeptidase n=1 Tax=Nocardioides sp. GXZ039 TaxID=3136018 RepID=UPI0030F3C409
MRRLVPPLLVVALLAGCAGEPGESAPSESPNEPSRSATAPTSTPATASDPSPTTEPTTLAPDPRLSADDVEVATAFRAVEHLADMIGPRPGHTEAYFRAAAWAERQLTAAGWQVERQRFPTPAGNSWGVPVEAGPSVNLIATRGEHDPSEPWLLVGAHLDTVPQAPGAEDNASGVGVLLALAEAMDGRRTRLPVTLVLFGSEEPRGPGEAHHYGSKAYVSQLGRAERRSLEAMVSLDRVGVGDVVPVQTVREANDVSTALERVARQADVPTVREEFETSSDHESFADEGLPAARLGSTPYAGYHSAGDLPSGIDRAQLARVGRLMASWLR